MRYALLLIALLAVCGKKPPVKDVVKPAPVFIVDGNQIVRDAANENDTSTKDEAPETWPDLSEQVPLLKPIHFDFDKDYIRPDQVYPLRAVERAMSEDPALRLTVEGHCDERGTDEYNYSLGLRRATSATDCLVSRGMDIDRIRVVSYGRKQPVDKEHNERAWAKNRRAEFILSR